MANIISKQFLLKLFKNQEFLWLLNLALNVITFSLIYFRLKPNSRQLALHYNVLVGIEWYGQGKNLYLIPTAGLMILVINFILFRSLRHSKDFFAPLAIFASACVQIILLCATIFLISIN